MYASKDVRDHPPLTTGGDAYNRPSYSLDIHTLYVKRLPKSMNDEAVRNLFSPYGEIISMKILENMGEFPTNRAYIGMKSTAACNAAIEALNGWDNGLGNKMYVMMKEPKNTPPGRNFQHRNHPGMNGSSLSVNTENGGPGALGAGRGSSLLKAAAFSNHPSQRGFHHQPRQPQGYAMPRYDTPGGGFSHRGRGGYNQGYNNQYYRGGPGRGRGQYRNTGYRYPNPHQGHQDEVDMFNNMHLHQQHTPNAAGDNGASSGAPPPLRKVKYCSYCSTPAELNCSGCKVTYYCSAECQTQDWKQKHKDMCSKLKEAALNNRDLSKFDVHINTNIIKAIKSDKTTMNALTDLNATRVPSVPDSDTESLSSSITAADELKLPLDSALQVKLTDFISPNQFFVQRIQEQPSNKLPRVYECALYGVTCSTDGTWPESTLTVCSRAGLAIGMPCTVTCKENKADINLVKLILRNGTDLSDHLINAEVAKTSPAKSDVSDALALPDIEDVKCRVDGSLHTKLSPGDEIDVTIEKSSVKSINDFYVQVGGSILKDDLSKFAEMDPKLSSYAGHIANKPPPNYKAEEGDFVLAPFENWWYRGQITACNDSMAVVAFIDYGNVDTVMHQQLIPIPQQFCDVPAWSTLCRLHGITSTENKQFNQLAAEQIQALAGDRVRAVVRSVTADDLSVDLYNEEGDSISDILTRFGYAIKDGANRDADDSMPTLTQTTSSPSSASHQLADSTSVSDLSEERSAEIALTNGADASAHNGHNGYRQHDTAARIAQLEAQFSTLLLEKQLLAKEIQQLKSTAPPPCNGGDSDEFVL